MKTQTQRHPPTYRAFLENKIDIAPLSGIDVAESELNPALKHHQKVSVLWALRGGRRGIFARFGLGKSAMQLEWCRILQVHEGGQTLIVMPLNVLPEFRADAVNILGMDPPPYCRTMAEVKECSAPIVLTNYERVRDGDIDPRAFTAVSLDEAATLRSFGSKTYQEFMRKFKGVRYMYYHQTLKVVTNFETARIVDSENFVGSKAQVEMNTGYKVANAALTRVRKVAASG